MQIDSSSVSSIRISLWCKNTGNCPRFIRTDKGSETTVVAVAHHILYFDAFEAGMIPVDGTDSTRLDSCWIWGKSTGNVRIERLGRTLLDESTACWRRLFHLIRAEEYFREGFIADQVVMLFVSMPIIRHEVTQSALDENEYPIPLQRHRGPLHIPGVPNQP
jgi:hypothetical protein